MAETSGNWEKGGDLKWATSRIYKPRPVSISSVTFFFLLHSTRRKKVTILKGNSDHHLVIRAPVSLLPCVASLLFRNTRRTIYMSELTYNTCWRIRAFNFVLWLASTLILRRPPRYDARGILKSYADYLC